MKSYLVIHHTLTADSAQTMSWDAIRRVHREWGWRDIGYHLGIERIEETWQALVGRPPDAKAAAAYQDGMNRKGFHVAFTGNFDEYPPPQDMLDFAAPILAGYCEVFGIPLARVIGHRDIVGVTKSCPGKLFDLDRLRKLIEGA